MATSEELPTIMSGEKNADVEALMAELNRLRTENEEYKKRQRPVTFSVSERGAVCVHGIGKNPVVLYKVQWERILSNVDNLKKFMTEHEMELN
jgi:hypothetical protein